MSDQDDAELQLSIERGYEVRGESIRLATFVGLLLVGIFGLGVVVTVAVLGGDTDDPVAELKSAGDFAADVRGPRLQPSPSDALREMRAAEAAVLGSYGWEDRERGIVRLPIERAMGLVVEEGLPVRDR